MKITACYWCKNVRPANIRLTGPMALDMGADRTFCSARCFWKWIDWMKEQRAEWLMSSPEASEVNHAA